LLTSPMDRILERRDPRRMATDLLQHDLQSTEDLQNLKSLRKKYERQKTESDRQLRTVVQAYVDEAAEGMSLVQKSYQTITTIQESFKEINDLGNSADKMIPHFDKIREVGCVAWVFSMFKLLSECADVD
jgi:hypothetical protein